MTLSLIHDGHRFTCSVPLCFKKCYTLCLVSYSVRQLKFRGYVVHVSSTVHYHPTRNSEQVYCQVSSLHWRAAWIHSYLAEGRCGVYPWCWWVTSCLPANEKQQGPRAPAAPHHTAKIESVQDALYYWLQIVKGTIVLSLARSQASFSVQVELPLALDVDRIVSASMLISNLV